MELGREIDRSFLVDLEKQHLLSAESFNTLFFDPIPRGLLPHLGSPRKAMPPTTGLRRALDRGGVFGHGRTTNICLVSSHATRPLPQWRRKPLDSLMRRYESTDAGAAPTFPDPRRELESALYDLQTQAGAYVNLARLQLALRNLSQPPGHESIRVAFLALKSGVGSGGTTKKLLRLALADPLKATEDWEAQLEAHDLSQPLIVRVGELEDTSNEDRHGLKVARAHVIPEIHLSSPVFNGASLEMLVMGADTLAAAEHTDDPVAIEDAILAPTVEVAAPPQGPTPIATPVHMALLIGDGISGAAEILSTPLLEDSDTITAAINFKKVSDEDMLGCPLIKVSVAPGDEGLRLFRENVGNAIKYQALWSESNINQVGEWLKSNVLAKSGAEIKTPVRNLILSLLQNADAAIQTEEARDLSVAAQGSISVDALARLNQGLSIWAQNAHGELQQRLEAAFTGQSWRKLGWWKLFWRADDVGMVSSEMLALRFLPDAERGIIYLAGRVQEAGIAEAHAAQALYSSPRSAADNTAIVAHSELKWPAHISFTRIYLQEKTVPALQALAQKLVLQTTSGAAMSTALAVLTYFSAVGAYESGAIAALGIVWSLARLQKKWETARQFWEGEVREEGRKAIRATEASIAEVLDRANKSRAQGTEQLVELRKAREIIKRAEDALARLK